MVQTDLQGPALATVEVQKKRETCRETNKWREAVFMTTKRVLKHVVYIKKQACFPPDKSIYQNHKTS